MTFKAFALTTTAITFMAGAAIAQDNATDLLQDGTGNDATINQSAGSNNIAGNDATEMVQFGDYNELTVNQSGNRNKIGLKGNDWNDTSGIFQSHTVDEDPTNPDDPGNLLTIRQSSDNNEVGAVSQISSTQGDLSRNSALLIQRGDGNHEIGSVQQYKNTSSKPSLTVDQRGSSNRIDQISQWSQSGGNKTNTMNVTMTGNNNGHGGLSGDAAVGGVQTSTLIQGDGENSSASGGSMDILISGDRNQFGATQYGSGNELTLQNISGSYNEFGSFQQGTGNAVTANISGDSNQIGSIQNDASNILTLSSVSGNNNDILSDQAGTGNEIIASVSGDFNDIDFDQDGTAQFANANISGISNQLLVRQDDGGSSVGDNDATVNISGNYNGLGESLSTVGGEPLTSGELVQSGSNNELNMTVSGDRNEFAVMQDGNNNTFTGTQITNGNQMAVLQVGDLNSANVTQ